MDGTGDADAGDDGMGRHLEMHVQVGSWVGGWQRGRTQSPALPFLAYQVEGESVHRDSACSHSKNKPRKAEVDIVQLRPVGKGGLCHNLGPRHAGERALGFAQVREVVWQCPVLRLGGQVWCRQEETVVAPVGCHAQTGCCCLHPPQQPSGRCPGLQTALDAAAAAAPPAAAAGRSPSPN